MKVLKCPHCKNAFTVDDEMFESIANQVRNTAFNEEVERRANELLDKAAAEYKMQRLNDEQSFEKKFHDQERKLAERDAEIALLKENLANAAEKKQLEMADEMARKDALIAKVQEQLNAVTATKQMEMESQLLKKEQQHKDALAEKDRTIYDLKSTIAQSDGARRVAILEEQKKAATLIQKKEAEIADLRNKIETEKKDAATQIASLKERHMMIVSEKDKEIQYHKDFKARLSTKMIGETLEIHCQTLFNQAQSMGMFPDAYFAKDNDARTGSKGDFIFRDYVDSREYISIMFEMKNESDSGSTKHKNDDFLEKLDKDRREKNCEYAVLVSMLERDNELYNDGIVNKSHRYPKMYVIRPQMFMTLIALLCQASRKSLAEIQSLRAELEVAKAQSIDVTNFEKRRDQFALSFGKLVEAHIKKHNDAIGGIDKVIESLEKQVSTLRKVKELFETSEQKLLRANESVETDFTIKKLTYGNPTMKAKFEEAKSADKTE